MSPFGSLSANTTQLYPLRKINLGYIDCGMSSPQCKDKELQKHQ